CGNRWKIRTKQHQTNPTTQQQPPFKTGALNHSATLPERSVQAISVYPERKQAGNRGGPWRLQAALNWSIRRTAKCRK
ncbi:MAG: hypothetical protein WCD67_21775, partial [Xanthobacteraceae bacterium]